MRITTLLFLLLVYSVSFAQNNLNKVSGSIIDNVTGLPVEYATVVFSTSDSSFITGSVSDIDGKFILNNLPISTKAVLSIRHFSFNDTTIVLKDGNNSSQPISLRLTPRRYNLNEVVVNGKMRINRNGLTMLEYIVTDEVRKESPLATDVLDKAPGVYVDFNNNVWIKGSSKVLILKNGIELPNKDLINQIAPNSIEKIEINTALSSRYASKDYTAVINIKTKDVNQAGALLHGNLSPMNNLYDADASLNLSRKKHNFYSFYKLYYRNFEEHITTTNINDTSTSTYNLKVLPRKEMDHEFNYGYNYKKNEHTVLGIDGYTSLYSEKFNTQIQNPTYQDYMSSKELFNTYNYQTYYQRQDSLTKLEGNLSWNLKQLNDKNLLALDQIPELRDETVRKISGWVDIERKQKQILINLGAEYNNFYVSEKISTNFQKQVLQKYTEDRLSTYFDLKWENSKRGLKVGANLYYYNRQFQETSINLRSVKLYPAISYIEKINTLNTLKLSFTTNLQNPTMWQMLSLPITLDPLTKYSGNPYLKPEITQKLCLEYSYSKEDTYLSLNCFSQIQNNCIQQEYATTDTTWVYLTYKNISRVLNYGTSGSLNFTIFSWWKIKSYTEIDYIKIKSNETFYKTEKISWLASITSYWPISKHWFAAAKYSYNSSKLVYKGIYEPYNSSLFQIRYNTNKNLKFSFLVIQPIDGYNSSRFINDGNFSIKQTNRINVRTFLISINYSIFKNSVKQPDNLYYNEDKKY